MSYLNVTFYRASCSPQTGDLFNHACNKQETHQQMSYLNVTFYRASCNASGD